MNVATVTITAIGWLLLGAVVVGTVTCMAGITAHPAVVAVQGAAPRLVILGIAAGALLTAAGRTALGASLLLAGALWATFLHVGTAPAKNVVPDGERLRILSANLLLTNEDYAAVAADVIEADPDVLVTVETSEAMREGLAGRLTAYRKVSTGAGPRGAWATIWEHERVAPRNTGTGTSVQIGASTLPAATYRIDGEDVVIIAVHLHAPSSGETLPLWETELAELTEHARAHGRRLVLAGDFNTGHAHPGMDGLLALMHDEGRTPWGTGTPTWPVLGRAEGPYRVLPPLLDLDHILVGPELGVAHQRVVRIHGSDHLGLLAEVGSAARLPTSPARPRS